jgi:hypothetical protein
MKKKFAAKRRKRRKKKYFLHFLPAPGVYECLRECGVRIFAAAALRFFFRALVSWHR